MTEEKILMLLLAGAEALWVIAVLAVVVLIILNAVLSWLDRNNHSTTI